MTNSSNKTFVARAIYHHKVRTSEVVTVLVYKDSNDVYELFDDREVDHDNLAGGEEYVFEEWGKRNRQLVKDGFRQDNLTGDNRWQQFIS
jgi:hypothetical protein